MTTTEQKLRIIDFLPKSLIDLDRKEGTGFLERFLNGPQDVWRIINEKIWGLLNVNDPDLCPDVLLKFRKSTVGFTPELDYITENLSDSDLRKLIRVAMTLWRLRGGRPGIRQALLAMTGRPVQIYDWFDKCFKLETTGMEFVRRVETDSNLLGENFTIDAIEGFDGITSDNPKNKIFTSASINFREKHISGGESLILFGDDAGVFEILKRINDHQIQVTKNFPQGGSTNVHFQIQGDHSEFITDIHIDASGDLNRELVGNLLALQRAPSEIFDVYFWGMLETFEAFNRWGIAFFSTQPENIEIKIDDDGEHYVEIFTTGEAENGILTAAGPTIGTDAFIFESTFEFESGPFVDTGFSFIFNGGELLGPTVPPTAYMMTVGFAKFTPNSAIYTHVALFKITAGSPIYLFNLFSEGLDVVLSSPQLQPGVKNMTRVVVEKRNYDGANLIQIYINGQRIAEVIDDTDPIEIRPAFAISCVNRKPTAPDMTLKIYDFKFASIRPMERLRIGLNSEIEEL